MLLGEAISPNEPKDRETGRSGPTSPPLRTNRSQARWPPRTNCHDLVKVTRPHEKDACIPAVLERERGVRNLATLADFTEEQVADWVRKWRERTGRWPYAKAGAIPEAPGETVLLPPRLEVRGSTGPAPTVR